MRREPRRPFGSGSPRLDDHQRVHHRTHRSVSVRPVTVGARERSRRTETGSISAFVALFAIALFALMGLVLDGGSAISAQQSAYDEAEQAARAGAGALSMGALRSGVVAVNPQAAIADAVAYTVAAGHPGTASVANGVVTVKVEYRIPTSILGMVGIPTLPVSASASAVVVHGVTKED
ncbi:MAG: TadE/TadG family type IV pilus assembly protein [Acidimicrobiales bacterium]